MRLIAALALIALPAMAGLDTAYKLYPCAVYQKACAGFDSARVYHGDFGMSGIDVSPDGEGWYFDATYSNKRGEVVGRIDIGSHDGIAYGFHGEVSCVPAWACGVNIIPIGMNENGLYITNQRNALGFIGLGRNVYMAYQDLAREAGVPGGDLEALGINSTNQILARYAGENGGSELAILSTRPIPEPSSVALFGILAAVLGRAFIRRRPARAA